MSDCAKRNRWIEACVLNLLLSLLAVAAEPTSKPSPPDAASVKEALNTVNEVYKSDVAKAKTPHEWAAIADKLMAAAKEEKDAAARFALLSKARDIAVESGDYDRVSATVDAVDAAFEVDALKMMVEAATATAKTARGVEQKSRLAAATSRMVDQAIVADKYDIAKSAADVGFAVARNGADTESAQEAVAKVQQVRELTLAYSDVKKAMSVLADKPSDRGANLTVGKFRCFYIGDWENGLPMLAIGGDPVLQSLAAQDASAPAEPDAQVKLGDGWWELAAQLRGTEKLAVQRRAKKWYATAMPKLSGLAKSRVEKRIAAVEAPGNFPKPKKPFECRVVSATYGAGNRSVDVTRRVSELLATGQAVTADAGLRAGDPVPNVVKTLSVRLAIGGQSVILSVPDGRTLSVRSREDARTSGDTLPPSPLSVRQGQRPIRIRGTPLIVTAAVYGVDSRTADVTERVADLLQASGSVHVTDDEMAVPDPAWGVVKSLTIELDIEHRDVIVVVQHGGQVTLQPAQ